jgi:hypothetical protein
MDVPAAAISICFLLWVHAHVTRLWLAHELIIGWDISLLAKPIRADFKAWHFVFLKEVLSLPISLGGLALHEASALLWLVAALERMKGREIYFSKQI